LKQKLVTTYGQHITFADVRGRKNVVCFRDLVSHIISDKWYEARQEDDGSKAERLVRMAARMIRAQIREMESDMSKYPSCDQIVLDDETVVPPLLKLFCECMVEDRLKCAGISQALTQTARPKTTILPIPFALGSSSGQVWICRLDYRGI
jgi:hypothetical protein